MNKPSREVTPVTKVTVKVDVPVALFKRLNASAHDGTTVGQMILELAKEGLAKPSRRSANIGPRSLYTSDVGAKMLRLRELNRSVAEVATVFGLTRSTARAWLNRAEDESRERASGRRVA